ncbi:MAG: hypothetical protein PHO86_02460 [Bacilli bacterium]|nr:hypothetical protein [Bacilli bacterium]
MKCKKTRTIFELFAFYDCSDCITEDEFFLIGNRVIGIYYIEPNCDYLKMDREISFAFSLKLKRLLYEAIINKDKIVLLLLDNKRIEGIIPILDSFLEWDLDIQIIIY